MYDKAIRTLCGVTIVLSLDDRPPSSCALPFGNHDLGARIYPAAPTITIATFAKRNTALRSYFFPKVAMKSSGRSGCLRTACSISA